MWLVIETLIQKRLLKNGDTLGFLQNLQGGEVLFKGNDAFAHDTLLIFLKFGSLIAEPNLKSEQQKYWFSKLVTDVLTRKHIMHLYALLKFSSLQESSLE